MTAGRSPTGCGNAFNADNALRFRAASESPAVGLPPAEGPKRRQLFGFRIDFQEQRT